MRHTTGTRKSPGEKIVKDIRGPPVRSFGGTRTPSLIALRDLASGLALGDAELAAELGAGFDDALSRLAALDDPVFASVSVPQTRLKVEIVQQSIETIHALVRDELGPRLGVAAGFNSLDGD